MPALFNRTPTARERIPEIIQDALVRLGVNTRKANSYAYRAADVLDYTPVGAAAAAWDAGVAAQKRPGMFGKMAGLGGGLAMAALGAVPGGRKGKLAMDEASRMARAAEQGFDTTRPLYHGTTAAPFDEFEPSKYGSYGPGVYTTTSPTFAERYSLHPRNDMNTVGRVEELYGPKVYDLSQDVDAKTFTKLKATLSPNMASIFNDYVKSGHSEIEALSLLLDKAAPKVRSVLKRAGYGGFRVPAVNGSDEVVVFDPANLRRTQAAFDPAKRNSRDLMAGVAPFAALGGLGSFGLMAQPKQRQEY